MNLDVMKNQLVPISVPPKTSHAMDPSPLTPSHDSTSNCPIALRKGIQSIHISHPIYNNNT